MFPHDNNNYKRQDPIHSSHARTHYVPPSPRRRRSELGDKVHVIVVHKVAKVPVLEDLVGGGDAPVAVAPVVARGLSELVTRRVEEAVPRRTVVDVVLGDEVGTDRSVVGEPLPDVVQKVHEAHDLVPHDGVAHKRDPEALGELVQEVGGRHGDLRQQDGPDSHGHSISHLREALDMYTAIFGPDHKDTSAIASSLRQWLAEDQQ